MRQLGQVDVDRAAFRMPMKAAFLARCKMAWKASADLHAVPQPRK